MNQEELTLLERARKALSDVKATGHNLKALNFVLSTLDNLVEGAIRAPQEGEERVH